MKKLLTVVAIATSLFSFAHMHGEEITLKNEKKYMTTNALTIPFSIGNHDDEIVAKFNEGHVDLVKTGNMSFESLNKSFKFDGKNITVSMLLFDQHTFNKAKYEKNLFFHSYNEDFPHTHVNFNKDYTKVTIEDLTKEDVTYTGTTTVLEDSGNLLFTEQNKLFYVVIYKGKDKTLPTVAQLIFTAPVKMVK